MNTYLSWRKTAFSSTIRISSGEEVIGELTNNAFKQTIEYEEKDDLLVLTGMFVTNYFQRAMIVIMVAVFIPIWVSVIN